MTIYVRCDVNINWFINCEHGYCCLKVLRLNYVCIVLPRLIVLH